MIQGLAISILVLLGLALMPNILSADELNEGVVSKDSKLFGKSYGEWAAAWWQWFGAIPVDNPGEDTTGENCGLGQNDPNMWYLIESFNETKYTRECTIPQDRYIFVPSLAAYCDTILDGLKSENDLVACAKDYNIYSNLDLSIELNGKKLNSVNSYRVTSPLTNFAYPENNILNDKDPAAYTSQGVVDGWFVILEPLTIGKHQLHIKTLGTNLPKGGEAKGSASYDIFYNLTIK